MGKRKIHPKSPKKFKSKESYRRFLAYTHIRTPSGKRAKSLSQTISAKTPTRRKEGKVFIAGKPHYPKMTKVV